MSKLFEKKDPSELRSRRIPVLFTQAEAAKVEHFAAIRKLSVAEYMRRTALKRRADVDYQTDMVLALTGVTRSIRALHAAVVANGHLPPESEWLPVILETRAAILRITK